MFLHQLSRCLGAAGIAVSLAGAVSAAEVGPYAPANLAHTESRLGWQCMLHALCPVSDTVRSVIRRARDNDRGAAYLLGLTLLTGDGLPQDRDAGLAWVVIAAELGEPAAVRDIQRRQRNGAAIELDEAKVVAALQPQVDAGGTDAMRALGPMYINGRGVDQDTAKGVALLQRAAALGSSEAETDLFQLYLNGGPGVPANRAEAMRWLTASARHGNGEAMLSLGYMSLNAPSAAGPGGRNVVDGYCWLVRSALLDQAQAQEKLSMVFSQGEKDEAGNAIAVDLVQADLWLRLAARSPYHDNSQIRASIEPKMTTTQINEAKRRFEAWHALPPERLRTQTIPLPARTPGGSSPGDCPSMS